MAQKVLHKTKVVRVSRFKTPRWYWECTCGRVGKRQLVSVIVERGAKLHVAHKTIAPKPGVKMSGRSFRYS